MKKSSFGDILNKWEHVSQNSQDISMEQWLEKNQIYDKDAETENNHFRSESRKRLKSKKPDDVLDIHGLTRDEAWLSLENFFERAKERGLKKLRIIHGKGNNSKGEAVLGPIVRTYIERCSYAGEFGFEKAANGGSGATWILLKNA